jgi:hypothetical protein
MDIIPAPQQMPARRGLPVDPVLQLWGGQLQPWPPATWTGGNSDPIAIPNPMRVALYTWPLATTIGYAIGPAPGPIGVVGKLTYQCQPTVCHCRDYPGMAQGAWVGSGPVGESIGVAEYVLQPWW